MSKSHKSIPRRRPTWPEATVPVDGLVLGLDPGPTETGWCVLAVRPGEVPAVLEHGHDLNDKVADMIRRGRRRFVLVAVEGVVAFGGRANGALLRTAQAIGRFKEAGRGIAFQEMNRRAVMIHLTGIATGPGAKVSKADMQATVQQLLGLSAPIRPQHANDACCAGLVLWGHPRVQQVADAEAERQQQRKARPRRRKSAA